MSYLMRNGTGRNNIVFGGSSSTNGQYLRRTSTGRNNISYIIINNTNGTYNLLERYNTTRNGIRWNNLTFSFGGDLTKYSLYTIQTGSGSYGIRYQIYWGTSNTSNYFNVGTINKNGYTGISKYSSSKNYDVPTSTIYIYYQPGSGQNVYNEIFKYDTITISGTQNSGSPFSYTNQLYTTIGSGLVRVTMTEYSDYSCISFVCNYNAFPGNYPDLSSIIFS